jgi:hypothetical protein
MLFLLLAGSQDRAIRMGSLIAYMCDRIILRLEGESLIAYMCDRIRCAIRLGSQIAYMCDHIILRLRTPGGAGVLFSPFLVKSHDPVMGCMNFHARTSLELRSPFQIESQTRPV